MYKFIFPISNYCEFLEFDLHNCLNELGLYDKIKRYNWNGLDNIYEISEIDKKHHKKLKDLLVKENDLGVLRQELVSMIPVSLADIQEDSIIMDMCAAPGNKSVQILEIMQERAREKNILPTGVLISNELDYKRGEKLVHLLQSQPTINVISTLCPAQDFPKIKNPDFQPNFIFCDVPCSGDGTLRKNKGLRKRWKPDYGYKNHSLQIEILENSIRLCKLGGTVIYSTCSINPVENEAVVAYILEKYKDDIELVEISGKIKNKLDLKFSEGLVKWKVAYDWSDTQNVKWAYDYSQVKKNKNIIKESMFNEIYTKKNYQNNIYFSDPLNLRRCARFYSHQNNSGSFFIAVIHKKREIKIEKDSGMNIGESVPFNHQEESNMMSIKDDLEDFMKFLGVEKDEKYDEIVNQYKGIDTKKMNKEIFMTEGKTEGITSENEEKENNPQSEKEPEIIFDKFVKFKDYQENFKIVKEFYNFKDEELISRQLYTLRTTSSKILIFSEKLCYMVKILSDMNLNIVHAGLICLTKERKPFPGKYRLSHYGAIILEPLIQNQKLDLINYQKDHQNQQDEQLNKNTKSYANLFFELLVKRKIKFDEIQPEELKETILSCKKGSLILIYESIVLLCRKGNNNLSIMIPEIQLNNLSDYAVKYLDNIN